jgi:enterochelin esterase-like enzyme
MSKPFQSLLSPLQKLFPSFKKRTSFSPQIISVQDFASQKLKREVRLDIFLPPGYAKHPYQYYPLLIFNDGQDLEAINLKQALERLYRQKRLQPIIAVGVFAGDRMQEYGTAQYPDYKKRGEEGQSLHTVPTERTTPLSQRRIPDHRRQGHRRFFAGRFVGI